ncbi:MAG: FCD domain-containing protein [Mesorhizobium sp.]|uniref:GntR family transcriptional regulator n=1 Tax=Mesorhizobium sp. M7A.F.Ce.TU.012.03.2.1 TaxID=2493681 RepID=UPI000FDC070E|nr:GntR family transcriptional regulator [Mesorhizobium sp. M7A.F.Ce.TU.012.03.2.1]AZV18366.1 GntR family transcriptional regulator [Mesorhizobium sp. M7A.F.Ce.TU.012.03.2.1]TIM17742.1 MAG: FCD domain-containing protein [Mesorhizobium sp.]
MDLDPSTLNRALPLRDQIYHKIRNLIVVGQLKPGEVINEVAIAEALGVSRTPVREAVKRISDEGLVKILAQTGTYVAPISRADLEEAYVIRRALEMESARRAAAKFTAAASELLEDNMAAHRLAISRGRYATAIQLDDVFHRTIAEICDLPMIWRAVDISKAQMDRGRYLAIPRPGYGEQTIEQHEAIFDALKRHDAEGAARAMEHHLETSFRNTLEVAADLLD